jgi:cytochrome c oxidase subunit IV
MSKIRNYQSRNFLVLFALLFGSLSGTIIIIHSVFKLDRPFAALYRMYEYHNEHPFQYIAIVSVVFGIVGACWIDRYGNTTGYLRWWTMTVAMLLTIVIASPFGGMLWQIHDMGHGFVPENYLGKVFSGISQGLQCGWLIGLLSMPMNLVGFATGYLSLPWLAKLSRNHN